MKRVYLWDNLKFFAILLIVLFHSTTPFEKDGMPYIKYIYPIINYYPMTLFAVISGYWYRERSYKELAILFLWPCLLFSIINNFLGSTSYYPLSFSNLDYWANFKFKVGPAMWYLMALFLYAFATKLIKRHIGITGYLIIAFLLAVVIGSFSIPNRFFDIQRISCLFPCFVFGLWIRGNFDDQIHTMRSRGGVRALCVIIIILCVLYNLFIIHYKPSMSGAFTVYYGLNMKAALAKWIMMTVRVLACLCLIIVVPNKEYWFTKYGSRTMNVYLLHDSLIFILTWGLLYNCRNEWYGILSLLIGVPLLCSIFFCSPVDRLMKKILFVDYLRSIKDKTLRQR